MNNPQRNLFIRKKKIFDEYKQRRSETIIQPSYKRMKV